MNKTSLTDFTDEELAAEIKRRAEDKKKPPSAKPPRNVNWNKVYDYITNTVTDMYRAIKNDEGADLPKDFEHWIYEMALEAIYGEDIWKWYKDNL